MDLRLPSLYAAFALAMAVLWESPAHAGDDGASVERGRQIAQNHCARCHAIGMTGESPFEPAPPFREIVTRYPVMHLEEAFAEGIVVGHPAMPVFEFAAPMIGDLMAYLESLIE